VGGVVPCRSLPKQERGAGGASRTLTRLFKSAASADFAMIINYLICDTCVTV
jgi:hypothetical protein